MKKLYLFLIISAFIFAQLKTISVQELLDSNNTIIDIRTKQEFVQTGTIKNSHKLTFFDRYGNVDFNQWQQDLLSIIKDKNATFTLVCRSSNRTKQVGTYLAKNGYPNVSHLKGGINNWLRQGQKLY